MRFQYPLNILLISMLMLFSAKNLQAQQATITIQQDEKISELLDLKKDLEKENKLSSNYTIQLYYGELGQANAIMRRYRARFGSWPASIEYETPNYKVWVGNFSERLEADRALMQIKEHFSSAFILKPNK
ncbi:MAG: translation initiation factor IF-2 [Flavobacteriaceae bacterium]|uniref:SPOR domain-containing protein n=1 Tax=Leeuwenhoekiella sp. UBA1003 TaxID=1946744 RepID=UPI000C944BFB|nr:SPOR domain-containing protein [Leeuwenhoekiella sp. UBA1003]MAT90024.1 translation initiation factor IF-2 [Flavobacteriaceae bacterium]|tara:strand:+ start:2937 stop:3326 length:390 start_codon:yes stop_codon:yes gene_type:complete